MTLPSGNRLRFGCPRCLTRLEAKASQAGKNRRCPVCYFKLTVPTAQQVAATAAMWREPGYQLAADQQQAIPSAAAYQTYIAVVCPVCRTRMYATPAQVGQEMRCPDCGTPASVAPPSAKPATSAESTPSAPPEVYGLQKGGSQPPVDRHEVYQRYIPVVCPICHTRMLATAEQVGQRLICPDCETPSIVPPPEKAEHEPPPFPSRDPGDVYGIASDLGPPPLATPPTPPPRLTAVCPVCHTRLDLAPDKAGKAIECPDCGTRFAVPRPKPDPPALYPTEETEEGYGLAAPSKVAPRKPAGFSAELDPEDHESVQERRGLEEEWKNFNQQLRNGRQVMASDTAPVRTSEPEDESNESFIRGVFTFPFYRSSMAYWVALSLGLMFVVLPPVFAYFWASKQRNPDWVTWVLVASILAVLAGLLWVLMTASTCLSILQDTAEGSDEVENWPEGQFLEWLFDTSYILTALVLAAAAGLATVRILEAIGQPWWPGGIIAGWIVFPFVLISLLEAGSPLLPLSMPIFRSLYLAWWAWIIFYVEATLLVAVGAGLGALVTIPTRFWGSPVALAMAVAVLMIYFRLLGRLVWFCSHTGALDEERPQRTDERLLHKRAMD